MEVTRRKRLWNRWFVLVWLISLCGGLGQNVLLNAVPLYVGAETTGTLSLAYAAFAVGGRLLGGWLADRKSRRLTFVVGCAVFCVSVLLFGIFSALPMLMLLRGLHGAGFSFVNTTASVASVDVVPPEQGSRSVGVFWVSMALAGGLAGYIVLWLNRDGDLSLVFWATAAILAVGTVLSLLCRYEKAGEEGVVRSETPRVTGARRWAAYRDALPAAVIMFLVSVSLSSVNTYAMLLASDRDYPDTGLFFLLSYGSVIAAALCAARLSEKLGAKTCLALGSGFFLVCALLVAWLEQPVFFYLLGVAYGVLCGLNNTITNVLAIQGLPMHLRGTGSSMHFVCQDLAFGLGGTVWGWTISGAGYGAVYTGAALFAAAGAALAWVFAAKGMFHLR